MTLQRLKVFLFLPLLVAMPLACPAQRNHGACIVQKTYTDTDTTKYMESRVYGNGLGDIIEEVQVGVTPSGKDLVVLKEYDAFRRMSKNWLPAGYTYNGDYNLNNSFNYINQDNSNTYTISQPNLLPQTITNVRINKNTGITWDGKYVNKSIWK